MKSAVELGKELIARYSEGGDALTQLKLQKLLYYTQAWALAIEGVPRFPESVEAWDYGPVVFALRQEFGAHGRDPLPLPEHISSFNDDALLDSVIEVYAAHEAEQLIALTHLERPWQETYKPFHARIVIDNELMRDYFTEHAVKQFDIHAQFIDTYRAKINNVIEWKPRHTLNESEIDNLRVAIGI